VKPWVVLDDPRRRVLIQALAAGNWNQTNWQ